MLRIAVINYTATIAIIIIIIVIMYHQNIICINIGSRYHRQYNKISEITAKQHIQI